MGEFDQLRTGNPRSFKGLKKPIEPVGVLENFSWGGIKNALTLEG